MNQASMFFTAVVMLAGAGWYVMASNPALLTAPAATEAKAETPRPAPLVARGPGPVAAKDLSPVDPPPAR